MDAADVFVIGAVSGVVSGFVTVLLLPLVVPFVVKRSIRGVFGDFGLNALKKKVE